MNPCINLCAPGFWDTADSYGIIACQLARQLTGMGCHVNAYALGGTQFGNQTEDIQAITRAPLIPALGGIFMGYPPRYHLHGPMTAVGPRIALTMFESSQIPPAWADVLNRCDAVVTPSHFCREVFVSCGVTAPIHVVPLGIAPIYQPVKRDRNRPLTFLTFLDRGVRKGGLTAINAFVAAFGDRDDVRLLVKHRHHRVAPRLNNPNITMIVDDYSEAQMAELYRSADVLISATSGEGFGLIPREFAATGGISLATAWSGTADDINLWGVPLDYKLVKATWQEVKALAGRELGVWAEVDRDGLAATLRRVADNREWYKARAERNATVVARRYRWENLAATVLDLWKEIADGYNSRAKVEA